MTTRTRYCRRWQAFAVAALVMVVSAFWAGCSPKKHYKILSFFFDGVPDPNAPDPRIARLDASGRLQLMAVIHQPFREDRCDACHRSKDAFTDIDAPSVQKCFACHDKVGSGLLLVHGPVAAKECLWCHDPHRSATPALLRAAPAKLCRECHTTDLLDPRVPEHNDMAANCVSCHYGHGGNQRHYLKPDVVPTAGATTLPAGPAAATRPAPGERAP